LEDLLGLPWAKINDDRLYRALDAVHGHKESLCQHLLARYQSWFGVGFEFLIYDVTSTFFERSSGGQRQSRARVFARSSAGLSAGMYRIGGQSRGVAAGV
jgi:hypothetical protein